MNDRRREEIEEALSRYGLLRWVERKGYPDCLAAAEVRIALASIDADTDEFKAWLATTDRSEA